MQSHLTVWIAYIAVALITLGTKLLKYMFGKKSQLRMISPLELAKEWFFESSKENIASWIGTIFVVWTLGYIFIEKTPAFLAPVFGPVMNCLPVAVPVAGLLGWAAEMAAPNFAKWLVGKLSSPAGG